MKFTQKKLYNLIFSLLFSITCIACTAEATEKSSKSTHESEFEHDTTLSKYGSNVPDSNLSSYSSATLQSSKHTSFTCILKSPYEVHRYELKCTQAEYLDVSVADCCIEGDLWQATAKVWDQKPNTAVTINPKSVNQKSVAARVYNYGGTETNLDKLTALVECSYKSGVNSFPAAALFTTESDGYCTLKDLGVSIKMH